MAFKKYTPSEGNQNTYIFRGRDMLVSANTGEPIGVYVPEIKIKDSFTETITGLSAIEVTQDFVPENGEFRLMREYFSDHGEELVVNASRMKSYLNWRMSTRFCCTCGTQLQEYADENARICPECKKVHYPRINPCIITVIEKDDKILLLRHKQRNQDIFACLAGFVEVGESIEHALRREVMEETGLEIENIRYMGSQSWPFPDQLMFGFVATYKSGTFKLQSSEIFEAGWFSRDNLPPSPHPGSIAWCLIHNDFEMLSR